MTKKRKSNLEGFGLPEPDEVGKIVSNATGQAETLPERPEMAKAIKKRSKREPYTTALLPKWKKALKMEALKRDVQPADVLEEILQKHFSK